MVTEGTFKATLSDGKDYVIEYTHVWTTTDYGSDADGFRGVEQTELVDELIVVFSWPDFEEVTLDDKLMSEIDDYITHDMEKQGRY